MGMLIFPHDESTTFNPQELRSRLASLEGVSGIANVDDGFVDFEWSFSDGVERASASLQSGCKAINIDPENRAAVRMAFDLSRLFDFPVDLVDDQYTYQLALSSMDSADDAWRHVVAAYSSH